MEGYDAGRKDGERKRQREGPARCRDGFSRDGEESARGNRHRGSGTRDWGAPRIRRKKKHRVNDPTRRRAVARY